MQDIQSLLNLPLETLLILVAGYIGYKITSGGMDHKDAPIDIVFIVLSFGLVAKLTFDLVLVAGLAPGYSAIVSLLVATVAGGLWRKWLARFWQAALRISNLDYSYGSENALTTIVSDTTIHTTQLSVTLKCGDVLWSEDLSEFNNQPHGPCVFGADGSVALYVTSIKKRGGADYEDRDAIATDSYWGSKITYIPASEVQRISVRTVKR